ncbi:hypothetical protein AGMMS49574_04780 [Bacteroidia bacterium]|nr:hypothetical protein AGMMS49574_04780 [Bacteroidia bacterium]
MKKLKVYSLAMGMILSTLAFQSCLDDDGYSLDSSWISIATARPLSEKTFYLTLDDGTSLWPAAPLNIYYQPTKPQRVQMNYTLLGDHFQGYDYAIKLNRIDTVLTKQISENLGAKNDSIYGTDPVEISAIWVGDGFLNVQFKAYYSGNFKHFVNLIRDTTDTDKPYKLEFRHNAFGDKSQRLSYGLVAFNLSEIDTQGKDVTLDVKVKTFDGVKEYEKKYNSGKNIEPQPKLKLDGISLKNLE